MKSSRDNTRQVRKLKATFSRVPFGGCYGGRSEGEAKMEKHTQKRIQCPRHQGRRFKKLDYNPSQQRPRRDQQGGIIASSVVLVVSL